MSRGYQIVVAVVGVVVLLTLVRLLLPYDVSDTKNIVPEIYQSAKVDNLDQHLADILNNNLWDKERQPLLRAAGALQAGLSSDDPASIESGQPGDLSFRLVGVSRGEAGSFAVIESHAETELYAPGAILPDGSQLEEVLEYGVRISKSGEHEKLYLFGKN